MQLDSSECAKLCILMRYNVCKHILLPERSMDAPASALLMDCLGKRWDKGCGQTLLYLRGNPHLYSPLTEAHCAVHIKPAHICWLEPAHRANALPADLEA